MIRHIVLFKLKDNSPEKVQEAANVLLSMQGKIEGLVSMQTGADFLRSERSYDLALECTFDTEEHFRAYAGHPIHQPVKAYMHTVRLSSVSLDYRF